MSLKTFPRVFILDPMWLLWGTQMRSNVCFGAFLKSKNKGKSRQSSRKESLHLSASKNLNCNDPNSGFHVFGHLFPRRLRGLQDVPGLQKQSDFCLELYLLLPVFLSLQRQKRTLSADSMSSLCGGAAMTRLRRLQCIHMYIYIYLFSYIYNYIYIYIHKYCIFSHKTLKCH